MRYESPTSEKERKVGNKKKEDDAKGKDIFYEKAFEKKARGNTPSFVRNLYFGFGGLALIIQAPNASGVCWFV